MKGSTVQAAKAFSLGSCSRGSDSSSDMRSGNTSNVHMVHSRPTREPVVLPQLALQASLLRGDEVGMFQGSSIERSSQRVFMGGALMGKPTSGIWQAEMPVVIHLRGCQRL